MNLLKMSSMSFSRCPTYLIFLLPVCVYIYNEARLFSIAGIKGLILVTCSVRLAVCTEDIILMITVCSTKS